MILGAGTPHTYRQRLSSATTERSHCSTVAEVGQEQPTSRLEQSASGSLQFELSEAEQRLQEREVWYELVSG